MHAYAQMMIGCPPGAQRAHWLKKITNLRVKTPDGYEVKLQNMKLQQCFQQPKNNINLRLLSEGSGLAGHGAGAPSGTGGPGGPGALAPHNSYRSPAS